MRYTPLFHLATVPLQVVKVKNSRGGQEGRKRRPRCGNCREPGPIFLCYLVQSGLEIKEAGESPEN